MFNDTIAVINCRLLHEVNVRGKTWNLCAAHFSTSCLENKDKNNFFSNQGIDNNNGIE